MTVHSDIESPAPAWQDANVLIYTIRRTDPWWRHFGEHLGCANSWTVSDLRGDGDFCVVDDFNREMTRLFNAPVTPSPLVSSAEIEDIISRCRVLRFLHPSRARAMVLAMATVFDAVLEKTQANMVVSFPIDRYVSDVLRLMAKKRGAPYFEITIGPLPETIMFMDRGALKTVPKEQEMAEIDEYINVITQDYFKPSYVTKQSSNKFSKLKFFKTFFYFKVRGYIFKTISILKRDRFNLHYLDAQNFMEHKPVFSDHKLTDMIDHDWEKRFEACPEGQSVFLGLSVFPEAAIDYWIDDLALVQYEDMMVSIAQELSDNGFHIFVKDHPLQFGFRKTELIARLRMIPNVSIVPYEVSGKAMVSRTDVTVTCTGTIGLEAAMLGKKAVVNQNYYTTPEDFIFVDDADVTGLAQRIRDFQPTDDLQTRQRRIIAHLLEGSCKGDFYAYESFKPGTDSPLTAELAREAAVQFNALLNPKNA